MEFIVKLQDGSHKGPLDQETLRKWVENDKVQPDTPVRNAMLSVWKEAKDFDFLEEALSEQEARLNSQAESRKSPFAIFIDRIFADFRKPKVVEEVSSAFKYEYLPRPATATTRIAAAAVDWALAIVAALVLLGFGISATYMKAASDTAFIEKAKTEEPAAATEEKAEKPQPVDTHSANSLPSNLDDSSKGFKRGSVWTNTDSSVKYTCVAAEEGKALWCESDFLNSKLHRLFWLWTAIVLAYFGASLGFFAQTIGMWYFGIFIVKKDGSPVFPLRAFLFFLLSIPLGFITFIISWAMPERRSIHDLIAGTKLIGIAAKPKT